MGDFLISGLIFIGSTILGTVFFFTVKPSLKKLILVNMIWLLSLFSGIYYATNEVKLHQATWKKKDSEEYIQFWFKMTHNQLRRNVNVAKQELEVATRLDLDVKLDRAEAYKWFSKQLDELDSNKTLIVEDFDTLFWNKMHLNLTDFVDIKDESQLEMYQFLEGEVKGVEEGFDRFKRCSEAIKSATDKGLYFYLYPFLLAIILGVRLSKEIYQYFKA